VHLYPAGKSITDDDVVKSLVLMVAGSPWVAVLRGQDRLDERRVADLVHVARRRVRLATREETLQATGFVPGTVPPLGHKVRICALSAGCNEVAAMTADNRQHVQCKGVMVGTGALAPALARFPKWTTYPLHPQVRLPTLVDVAVTRISGPVYGGGGDEDTELVVDVPTLLTHTTALVGY
jgi:prolyl-tRNA editing enzyme YbaK/EbsC (Cys-tRNA(Pro) deacylase)